MLSVHDRKRRVVYPELVAAQRCKLVVLGFEVGGRIDADAVGFIRRLAASKARGTPTRLRKAALQASVGRWTGMLAVAAQCAYALSLLERQTNATARNRPWRRCWRMPGLRSLWRPAAYLRRGGRADGRPAVGRSRPEEIMSCRHKSPRKKYGILVWAWMLSSSYAF